MLQLRIFASRKSTWSSGACILWSLSLLAVLAPLPRFFFQNRVPLLKWLCQHDAHRSSLQIDVLRCSPLLSQSDFFCNSWKCRTLARMQTGINFGSPTNQLNRWAITNSVYSNQPTSQTQCLAHPVINELLVEVWKMQAATYSGLLEPDCGHPQTVYRWGKWPHKGHALTCAQAALADCYSLTFVIRKRFID